MNILVIPSWYPTTYDQLLGVFFKEQAEALAKHGNNVGVIALQDVGIRNILQQKKLEFSIEKFVENSVNTYRLQYFDIVKNKSLTKKFKMYFFKKMFNQYIQENGLPDIIHLHSFLAGDFALYIREIYNIPYVVTEHLTGFSRNHFSLNQMNQARKIYENSEQNIVVSEPFRELMQNKFSLPFYYIPNVVNTNFFTLNKVFKREIYTFINIAHLDKKKNQDMLIQSFSKAFKNRPEVRLVIAGGGVEYSNLNDLINMLNMQDQISLFGRASREEVKNLLQNSDAFVLSSEYETFGVVIIEAMACGLPVLATKCGGPESIVTSDKLGLLSEVDKEELSKSLLEMYNKKDFFDPYYIRQYVEDNFSEKAVSMKLEEVYKKAVK